MTIPYLTQAAREILRHPPFIGDSLQVEEQVSSLVITGRVATLDLGLDLPPDAFAPTDDGVKPGAARAFRFLITSPALGRGRFGQCAFAGLPDRFSAGAQVADGARGKGLGIPRSLSG